MSFSIEQHGVRLKRVTKDDIELIRKWRNHPSIRSKMAYSKTITQSEQLKWFKSINNSLNYYFLIQYKNNTIGVINCKEININQKYGEGGIFIWDANHIGTPIPVFASVILIDFFFNYINVSNKSFIRILRDNAPAQKYNEYLGYCKIPGQESNKNQWYVLTKEDFNTKHKSMQKAITLYTQSKSALLISGKKSNLNLDPINDAIEKN